jgi:hypothetical protein
MQVWPFLPQAWSERPAWHPPLSQHPEHVTPLHAEDGTHALFVHTSDAAVQFWHVCPLVPQAALAVPGTQRPFAQHPPEHVSGPHPMPLLVLVVLELLLVVVEELLLVVVEELLLVVFEPLLLVVLVVVEELLLVVGLPLVVVVVEELLLVVAFPVVVTPPVPEAPAPVVGLPLVVLAPVPVWVWVGLPP